jgi:hypothetical protein
MPGPQIRLLAVLFICASGCALGDILVIKTDATWRTIKGTASVPADWNSSVIFDDSDQAGWTNSFKAPNGDRIWETSNLSADSPANPRFRHVFSLYGTTTSVRAHFGFDDDGTVWINGVQVLNDTNGSASAFEMTLDPSLFHAGNNLIAVWGHNTIAPYNTIEVDITNTISAPAPVILANTNLGVRSGKFGFDMSASVGQSIAVEASTNLVTWLPLATNTMTNTVLYWSDAFFSAHPSRFYRLRSP